MSWLWIVVVVFLAAMGVAGYKKGAVKMMLALGVIVGSLLIAAFAGPAVKRAVCENTELDEKLSGKIETVMLDHIQEEADVEAKIQSMKLPKFLKSMILANLKGTNEAVHEGIRKGSAAVTSAILVIAFTLLVFMAAWLVIELIVQQFIKTLNLPVLKQLDGIAGILVALIIGILVVDLSLLLLDCVSMTKVGMYLVEQVEGSKFLMALSDKNVVEMLFNTFIAEMNA